MGIPLLPGFFPKSLAAQAAVRVLQFQAFQSPYAFFVTRPQIEASERFLTEQEIVDTELHPRQRVDQVLAIAPRFGFRPRLNAQAPEIALDPAFATAFPEQVANCLAGIDPDLPAAVARAQRDIDLVIVALEQAQGSGLQGHRIQAQPRFAAAAVGGGVRRQMAAPGIGIDEITADTYRQAAFGEAQITLAKHEASPFPLRIAAHDQPLRYLAQGDPVLLTAGVRCRTFDSQR